MRPLLSPVPRTNPPLDFFLFSVDVLLSLRFRWAWVCCFFALTCAPQCAWGGIIIISISCCSLVSSRPSALCCSVFACRLVSCPCSPTLPIFVSTSFHPTPPLFYSRILKARTLIVLLPFHSLLRSQNAQKTKRHPSIPFLTRSLSTLDFSPALSTDRPTDRKQTLRKQTTERKLRSAAWNAPPPGTAVWNVEWDSAPSPLSHPTSAHNTNIATPTLVPYSRGNLDPLWNVRMPSPLRCCHLLLVSLSVLHRGILDDGSFRVARSPARLDWTWTGTKHSPTTSQLTLPIPDLGHDVNARWPMTYRCVLLSSDCVRLTPFYSQIQTT